MVAVCDASILASVVFSYQIEVVFLILYVNLFSVFKRVISKIDKTSDLYVVYNVFMNQTLTYLKGIGFILILSISFVLLTVWILYLNSPEGMRAFPVHFSYFLTWVFDNDWLFQMEDYMKSEARGMGAVSKVILSIIIYVGQFIYKHVVYRYFFSLVIGGYTKSREANEYLVTVDNTDILLQTWLQYDPESKGYIEVQEYFTMIINLPPPFFPPQEDLFKCFAILSKHLETIYPVNYPIFQEMDDEEREAMASLRERIGFGTHNLPRSSYFTNADNSRVFSVGQYFMIGRLLNLNVYQINKKE